MIYTCSKCQTEFKAMPSAKRQFCSRACGQKTINEKIKQAMLARPVTWGHKISAANKGRKVWNKGTKGICQPNTGSFKVGSKPELHPRWKGGLPNCADCNKELSARHVDYCKSCSRKGEKSIFWKGGITQNASFYNRKRRNLERNATGSHTEQEWQMLKHKYGLMCLCCKKIEPDILLTRDHVIPLIKGGTDFIENIQPLCKPCNSRKYNKIIAYGHKTFTSNREF
jgi:5-methylcytosine-specific restriction endonuclease McrA